ncbi:GIP, partial [Symbiodinium microadriaticum]
MVVPTFSGTTPGNGDDLGTSARSYLRQVAAWRRMTRMSEDQQALTLYQNLTDRAWIDAERLDMDRLATKQGVDYLIEWVKDRYLDVQVTQIGRSLSGFFRGLHRKAHQTVRDYLAEFDRAHARLTEVGCVLPDVAAAWVFVDRMGLEEQAELNLLASVGNQYSLKALQQAAIVHDRGLRKPWEQQPRNPKKEWTPRKPFTANLAGVDEGEELGDDNGFDPSDQEDCVSEEVAQDLFQAFMTHESAKQRYRENAKLRGSDPDSLKQLANDKLKAAKAKSFCAGCKRRGHWHKDAICPLNRGSAETSGGAADREKSSATTAATAATSTRTQSGMTVSSQYPCHVVHVTWEIEGYKNKDLLAITDTACSRSVAGAAWVDTYLIEARRLGCDPQFTSCREAFKFGASKIFVASYGIILGFEMGGFKVALKVAVVNGDVPLLVSRSALGKMGMLLDVAENRASFKALAVEDLLLEITETGHPAFQIKPSPLPKAFVQGPNWDTAEIKIFSQAEQYMGPPGVVGILHGDGDAADDASSSSRSEKCMTSWMVSVHGDDVDGDGVLLPGVPPGSNLPCSFEPMFYPKKIGPATRNMLLDVNFNPVTFAAWWGTTNISNDFWIEDEECLVRVHVIPRRSFFSPAHWRTQNTPHKEKLLSVLGAVRTINAVSCKSHKEFPAVHGLWSEVRDESSFPVLWIGRSIFRRKIPMPESVACHLLHNDGQQIGPLHGPDGDANQDDLVMFANWWQGQLHKWNDKVPEKPLVDRFDAERCATIPYVEDASSTASWDVLQRESLAAPVTPQPKAKSGGYSAQAPRTPPTRRPAEEPAMPTTTRMEQEIPPEINEEVRFLEERLALLKDQHGVSYHLEGADGDTDADDEGNYDDYLDHLGFDDAAVSYVTEEKVRGRHGRVQACEAVAKEKLEKKEYTYEDLLEIARLLPLRKLRKGKMPWMVKYMNSFVKAQGHGQWSSFVLFKNAATSVHADSHNLAGTMIKTVSFGPFTGGELWMSDPNRDPSIPGTVWRKDAAGNEIPGYLVNTKHQVYTFDGKAKHATQPWDGERWALSLYTTRGYQVTSLDYLVAEPLDNLYNFTTSSVCETVQSTIREFTPAVVWIHGDKATGYLDGIYDYLCEHVDKGRQLAVKAPPGDPCWDSPELNKILRRYEGAWCYREQEPDVIRVNDLFYYHDNATDGRTIPQFDAYVADHTTGEAEGESEGLPIKSGAEAISFEKGKNLAPEVKSSLRRLHQNLGHPSNIDLARHLRLAGADPVVIDACKRIRCQVCQRNKRGGTPKPASLPTLLEFNQVVAVDAFYVYDCEGTKVELMMAIDVGTGFALAGELQGHSTLTMEATFCSLWSNTFGAPGTLVVDLESGLQAGLARYSEWHGTFIRPIAGQAHWQNGTVERAIRTWKEVWVKLVDERSANADEANMVITAVNSAMNTLRRESGFSPSQAVWGRDPKLPDDIHHSFQDDHVEHIISHDRQRAREHTLRIAAKECYYRCRNDAKLRKGLLQRSRVAGPDLQVGCHVFFYRKPKNNKNWVWHGPGVIIGQEGPNHWVSFSGRCHLVAPEHLRMASAEELGAAFALRATKEDLEKLLEQDFSEEVLFEDDGNEMEVDPELPPGDDQGLSDGDGRAEASRRKSEAAPPAPVPKRYRTKGPQEMESHDPTYDAYMMKMAKTPRGREKALEKEIPWSMVPPEQQENFKQAELKQYSEHVEHNALEPLSVELSRKVMEEQPDRVLNSRFAYRDKHWSRRRQEEKFEYVGSYIEVME